MQNVRDWATKIATNVERAFLGKREVIEKALVAILCRGHVLLEDVPGVGKTIFARALAASIAGKFSRIQCTPDLLPTDVLGVSVFDPKEASFRFREGPIQANIVLVDEINRATPRTQSALLEAMAESQITVEGRPRPLPQPFLLLATENPVEFEGTFPLPEAQKDRFLLSLAIGYPSRAVEKRIVADQRRLGHPVEDLEAVSTVDEILALQKHVTEVYVEDQVFDYMLSLVEATRESHEVRVGVSPRGSIALFKTTQALAAIRGRDYVTPEDVKELVPAVFEKRIILAADYALKGRTADSVIRSCLGSVRAPLLEA
jgi:MoxR-like ATPase